MVQKEIIESNLYSVDIRTFTHELVNLLNEGWGDDYFSLKKVTE